jgi:YidC/Oxa1 family membrane protein insertase
MFTTIIVQPIFNLLVLIYALLPGHNFGLAIIIFTVIIRLLLWPLVKKQLHQTKIMRKLQPEVKRIKEQTKGDRQKQSVMLMELYKERGVNPLASFPTLIIQFIVLIGLYSGLRKVIDDPHTIVSFAYPALQHLSWMQHLAHDPSAFDDTLFGIVDLKRAAIGSSAFYFPAFVLVALSAITQYFASKQLIPDDKNARSLRQIMRDAGEGKQADQSEVSAAVGRGTRFFIPVMIFLFTISLASALSLYWFVGGLVAYIQQAIVLREDEEELEEMADKPSKKDVKKIPEAEVVKPKPPKKPKQKAKTTRKKRRKK